MAKFWTRGRQSTDSHPANGQDSERYSPDEHTSLLGPPPAQGSHRLSPDDPAVSPYNLLSVRSLRYVSIFLLFLSTLWWLVLLINTFITIPGLFTQGSGWFAFSYSTLATGTLLAVLVFYGTPSKTERGIWLTTLFFLFVNLIIIVSAGPIRRGENWIGIVSCTWAFVVTGWAIICDCVVEHGRHEENERLTGYRHARRSALALFSVFSGTVLLSITLIVTVLFTINLSILARDDTLSPPGHLYTVDNNRYSVHIHCVGNKTSHYDRSPTLLLESNHRPAEGRIAAWADDLYEEHHIQRYCYWDRPGYGWSDNGPSPLSAGMAVDALSEALTKAGEVGPWVLVSHGVGGIYSRIFASRHVGDVQGLLLIDTLPESLLHYLASAKRGFWLWFHGILYPLGIDRLVTTIFMGHHRGDRLIGKDSWQRGSEIKAKLQEQSVATTFTMNEVIAARAILPRDIPFAVVSSGKAVKKDKAWADGQRELSKLTDELIAWDIVDNAGHEVWKSEKGAEILQKRIGQLLNHRHA